MNNRAECAAYHPMNCECGSAKTEPIPVANWTSPSEVRLVQIAVSPHGLYALDQEGRLWLTGPETNGFWTRIPAPRVS